MNRRRARVARGCAEHIDRLTPHRALVPVKIAEELQPKRTYFTHICHDLAHERAESMLPDNVRLAYDGLEIVIEDFFA